jgi:hypothetical protein
LNRRGLRLGAALGAAALSSLAIAPAFAATTVSQATASALTLSIAGNGGGTGTVTATNDGTGETKTGTTNPPIQVLGNQDIINEGVLAQEATAQVNGSDGVSAACAGLAGQGGSVAQVGDSSCITPGDPIELSLGSINLDDVELIVSPEQLQPLNVIGTDLLAPLVKALSDGLNQTPLGEIGLSASAAGAIEGWCTAEPGTSDADANIADLQIVAHLPGGQDLVVADFPSSVAPKPGGTKVVKNLSSVTDQALLGVKGAITQQLTTMLGDPDAATGPLAPLAVAPPAIQEQVINNLANALQPALDQISDNIVEVTLNNRTFGDGGASVDETALSLDVLPAAAQTPLGFPLVNATIGHVTCGPNSTLAPAGNPSPSPEPAPQPGPDKGTPTLPTSVDSGVGGDSNTGLILGATGALLMVAGATGLIGYRRLLQK